MNRFFFCALVMIVNASALAVDVHVAKDSQLATKHHIESKTHESKPGDAITYPSLKEYLQAAKKQHQTYNKKDWEHARQAHQLVLEDEGLLPAKDFELSRKRHREKEKTHDDGRLKKRHRGKSKAYESKLETKHHGEGNPRESKPVVAAYPSLKKHLQNPEKHQMHDEEDGNDRERAHRVTQFMLEDERIPLKKKGSRNQKD